MLIFFLLLTNCKEEHRSQNKFRRLKIQHMYLIFRLKTICQVLNSNE